LPTIEIQDAQHHLLQTVDGSLGCMGHGWGPFTLDHGDPKRSFLDLRTPLKPGVYFLVSAWSPLVLEDAPDPNPSPRGPGPRRRLGDIYGIAHSRAVRVEIVP
jgi:hypothetical protein